MSETKHSPEPWWIDWEATKETMVSAAAGNVAVVVSGEVSVGCRPDARRIVACVNALAGIPTEALEAGKLWEALEAMKARHDLDRTVVYRDGPDGTVSLVGGTLDLRRTVSATSAVEDALRALGRLP
jgi:hypothetical protein